MLSIALTKGRLEKESVRMFERCGYGVEELKNKGRQLVFHDTVKDNRYFLVKAADSVTYVEHGVADIGFVGKDTLMEANGKYYEMMDLGIGKCGFIVAALPGCSPFEKIGHIKIGSKSPTWPAAISAAAAWMWKSSRSKAAWSLPRSWDCVTPSSISWRPERH